MRKSCLWYCRKFFGEGQIFGFIGIIIAQTYPFDFYPNFLKIQLLAVRDKRSIYIKIADRLHNLRTISHKDPYNQLKKAEETILFYLPLAEQLEMKSAAEEMRNICIEVLNNGWGK